MGDEARHKHEVNRTVSNHLVRDGDISALRVFGLWRHRYMLDTRGTRRQQSYQTVAATRTLKASTLTA